MSVMKILMCECRGLHPQQWVTFINVGEAKSFHWSWR